MMMSLKQLISFDVSKLCDTACIVKLIFMWDHVAKIKVFLILLFCEISYEFLEAKKKIKNATLCEMRFIVNFVCQGVGTFYAIRYLGHEQCIM